MAPPPKLTISLWADAERRLSPEASAEPGQWHTTRAEYQRGIMDAIGDPRVETVVVMSAAQVGKTESVLNCIGFYVAHDASPILVVQPTLEMATAFSTDRLSPMFRDTPTLRDKIGDPRSRDSGNTILHKQFPGGHITMAGANSPSSLASRPIRIVLCDEVDRYPPSAGTEGDPVNLARKRSQTFWNRKLVMTSTPTVKGASRIEMAYEASDRRRYWVPCPHCGATQVLRWAQVRWPAGEPQAARYVCEHCDAGWTDEARWKQIHHGEWIGEAPFQGTAGFHLNEIYSPWSRLGDIARAHIEAKKSPETLKVWINTSLGETWEDAGATVDDTGLMGRGEDWGGKTPQGVLVITAGVDVQDDRLEVELVGWGKDEESWSLDHRTIFGDPSAPRLWSDLDRVLADTVPRIDGAALPVSAACVDSGGHHTQAVYKFCRERLRRRVYAIKGMAGPGRPVWPKRASRNNTGRVNLFLIGVDAAKEAVYARLKIDRAGPGFCHFPAGRDATWFQQLTAEQVVTRYSKGFAHRVWQLRSGRRNEALDCRVYAYAALQSLNVSWDKFRDFRPAARIETPPPSDSPVEPARPAVPAPAAMMPRRPRTGWTNAWR